MRKLLALLLSVLMLASLLAAIPAFAATATYDGTTKDTPGLNKLIISEIGHDMDIDVTRDNETTTYADARDFVEIYNNGAGDVELDDLSLLLGVEIDTVPSDSASPYINYRTNEEEPLWKEWRDHYRFISEMEIKDGALIDSNTALQYTALSTTVYAFLTNAGVDMTLSNGENAVIWLITEKTIEWMTWAEENTADFDPRTEFLKSFYGGNATTSDYEVIMVWAYSDCVLNESTVLADDMFNLSNMPTHNEIDRNYIVGLAKDTWQVATDVAYDKVGGTINEDLYSMSVLGTRVPTYVSQEGFSVTCAPATAVPHIQNAYNKLLNANATAYTDYLNAGFIESYRETGVINWVSDPTPGMMPAWQWAIIDPDNANAPDSLKTEGAKDDAKVAAAIQAYVQELNYVDDGSGAGRDESDINHEYNFESQEDIKNRFNNKKKQNTTAKEDGLPTWALILIIVGGVLVVAGGACAVVFLVILPKKKAAAAVSAEDIPAEDAPAEDAPIEDAPAAEENKEE